MGKFRPGELTKGGKRPTLHRCRLLPDTNALMPVSCSRSGKLLTGQGCWIRRQRMTRLERDTGRDFDPLLYPLTHLLLFTLYYEIDTLYLFSLAYLIVIYTILHAVYNSTPPASTTHSHIL